MTTLDFPESTKAIWPLLFLAAVQVPGEKATLAPPLTVHITVYFQKAKSKVWGESGTHRSRPARQKDLTAFAGAKKILSAWNLAPDNPVPIDDTSDKQSSKFAVSTTSTAEV